VVFLESASSALFGIVRIIMYCAPVAALCAMAFTVGKYGLRTLLDLGQLVASVYIVCILFVLIVLGAVLRLSGFGIIRVLNYFKDEILFVLAATSAETMMPRSMQKLEKLGVSREVVGLVMPGGFSLNMDGTAIYMTMSVLFLLAPVERAARDAVHLQGRRRRDRRRLHRAGRDASRGRRGAGRRHRAVARRRPLHGTNPRRDQPDVQYHRDACGGALGRQHRHADGAR
jgi:hypothetical protein